MDLIVFSQVSFGETTFASYSKRDVSARLKAGDSVSLAKGSWEVFSEVLIASSFQDYSRLATEASAPGFSSEYFAIFPISSL